MVGTNCNIADTFRCTWYCVYLTFLLLLLIFIFIRDLADLPPPPIRCFVGCLTLTTVFWHHGLFYYTWFQFIHWWATTHIFAPSSLLPSVSVSCLGILLLMQFIYIYPQSIDVFDWVPICNVITTRYNKSTRCLIFLVLFIYVMSNLTNTANATVITLNDCVSAEYYIDFTTTINVF